MTKSHEKNPSGPDNTAHGSEPQSGHVPLTGKAPIQQQPAQQPAAQQAPAPPPAVPQPSPLAPQELWWWGAAGGLLSVVVTYGLFDRETIDMMRAGSDPEAQITTFVILGIVTAVAGGLWACVHKPIHSVMVALQLGILAPAAINALIATANPSSGQETSLNFMDELFISTAHAGHLQAGPQKPTRIDCIIRAIIKQPC